MRLETGRSGQEEYLAWTESLPTLARALSPDELQDLHLHIDERNGLSLEYRLPATSYWCDAVLLGRSSERPSAVMVELKNWMTEYDSPGPSAGLINHAGGEHLHPSDQVRGYVEYCQRFHSAVHEHGAQVGGCAFFTQPQPIDAYCRAPHDELAAEYPVFNASSSDVVDGFLPFLRQHIDRPDPDFAKAFELGRYHQDRRFCRHIARQIQDKQSSPFVLIGEQRLGYELCLSRIRSALSDLGKDQKLVLVVEGPPGSGKSILAAHLWAALCRDEQVGAGNIVITTTSASQRSNWEHLCEAAAGKRAARGIVVPANQYAPVALNWISAYNKAHPDDPIHADDWPRSVDLVDREADRLRVERDAFNVSIVDEAHALINPERREARAGISGWPIHLGPQAYHIMRASRVTIFLMDSEQRFRDNETTTPHDICAWAHRLGGQTFDPISLANSQFRCGGAKEYIDWLEVVLADRPVSEPIAWRPSSQGRAGMSFETVDTLREMDERLYTLYRDQQDVRLLSTYARPWRTRNESEPHRLDPEKMDFCIREGDSTWARIWNYVPKGDYSVFIQGTPGSAIATDPLCEIGWPERELVFDDGERREIASQFAGQTKER